MAYLVDRYPLSTATLRWLSAAMVVVVSVFVAGCGTSDSTASVETCPAFDPSVLTDLSFLESDSGVVVEAWSTEADRFMGLCTDEVLDALEAAGISFTVVGPEDRVDSTGGADSTVHLVSDGTHITGATRS